MDNVGPDQPRLLAEIDELRRQLAKSERKFAALSEQSPNMIFINSRGRVVYANRQCEMVMGYSRDEFYDAAFDFMVLIAEESKETVRQNFRQHAQGNSSPPYECRLTTRQQHKLDTVITTKLISYEGEMSILGIITDVTALKKTELELRETQRTLLTLMSNLPGAVYRCRNDHDWSMEFLSDGCLALTGYPPQDFIRNRKLSFNSLIHPADRDKVWNGVQQAIQKNIPYQLTYRIYDAQSQLKWVWEQGSGIRSPQGEVIALEGYITDISERKKAEEEKEKIQAQLLHSQKMEAVGRLAGGVAHDFNNLLTAIIGYSDFVMDGLPVDHELHDDLAEIKKVGQQAAALTRRLLAFSRMQLLQPKLIDLNELLTDMQNMLRRVIGEDIELTTVFETEPASVKVDPGQIEQVIMNLVVNARDAMQQGGRLLLTTRSVVLTDEDIKQMPLGRPGAFICLAVTDTGTGMSKEVQEHLFEPFFTTKDASQGTGLGLSVAYGIVRQHEGWIHVYSELGQGSEFKIYLPHVAERPEQRKKDTSSFRNARGNGERILLVEDEQKVRQFASKTLSKYGYVVLAAASAQEAIDIFRHEQGNIEVLFSDVVLSDQNGLQLATTLRAQKPSLHIMLTSGYTEQRAQLQEIQQLGLRFLHKPYTVTEMLNQLKQMLQPSQQG